MTENLASLKAREAESLTRLTAEGKSLYADDGRNWGAICAEARQLADDGRFREAVRMASKALFLGESQRDNRAQAYARRDLSLAYSYAGQLERALEYAEQSSKLAGNWLPEVAMVVHKVIGDVHLRRGNAAQAISSYETALRHSTGTWRNFVLISLANANSAAGHFEKARTLLADAQSSRSKSQRSLISRARAQLALAESKVDEALKLFSDALNASAGNDAAYEQFWALDGIARAHLAKGDKPAAIKAYLQAVEVADRVRTQFRNEEFKSGLFGDMRQVFDQATSLLAESGDAERAWEISERGRGRALLDMVRNRVNTGTGASAFVDTHSSPSSIADLRVHLPDDTAVVQYHVLSDRVIAWVIRKGSSGLFNIPIRRELLVQNVELFRAAILNRRTSTDDRGAELYRQLISPLELKPGESLVIVPHDALHYVPFQALPIGSEYLVERHPISYAPSAGTLHALLLRPQMSHAPTMLAFGNPDLGSPQWDLPGAQREVENLKAKFPAAEVFTRKEATKTRMLGVASKYRIVHVAAHAELDAVDPLFSRIRLASTDRSSGDLEAHEVYAMDLSQSAMVVLSACDSGLGRVSNGDEIWGFTRAFLGAGAASLVVSLWPVDDEPTERMMMRFYEDASKATDRRVALRQAQLELLKDAKTRDPFFWAPFTLVGSWR